jgi:hypothetical protein
MANGMLRKFTGGGDEIPGDCEIERKVTAFIVRSAATGYYALHVELGDDRRLYLAFYPGERPTVGLWGYDHDVALAEIDSVSFNLATFREFVAQAFGPSS